jgi:hypothetical protein
VVALGRTTPAHPAVETGEALPVYERVHVEQWRRDRLFAVEYVAERVRRGYL